MQRSTPTQTADTEQRPETGRPRRWFWLTAALLLSLAAVVAGWRVASEMAYRAARRELDRWAIHTAQDWLDWAQRLDRTSGRPELLRARCHRLWAQFDKWEQMLQAAEAKGVSADLIQAERVIRSIALGEVPPDARSVRADFVQAGFSFDDISAALVEGYVATQQWQGAEALLSEWERAAAEPSAHAKYMRAFYWVRRKQSDTAIELLQQALEIEPQHESARTLLAVLYDEDDRFEEALAQFTELFRRFPNNEQHHLGLAAILRKCAHLELARQILQPLVNRPSPDPEALLQMAQVALDAGEYQDAHRWFAGIDLEQARDVGKLGAASVLFGLSGDTIRALEFARRGDALEASRRRLDDVQTRVLLNPADRSAREELQQLTTRPELGLRLGKLVPDEPKPEDVPSGDTATGPELYALHCTICHGADGGGDGRASQHLFPVPRDFRRERFQLVSTSNGVASLDDLKDVTRRGVPGASMPAYDTLSEDEITLIAEEVLRQHRAGLREQFIARLRQFEDEIDELEVEEFVVDRTTPLGPVSVPPIGPADAASIARGRQLYLDQGCAQCHAEDGRGALDLPLFDDGDRPTRPRDLTRELFKGGNEPAAVFLRLAVGMPGTPHPAVATLSDAELVDLVHFVQSLWQDPPLELTNHERSIYATVPAYRAAFGD